MQNISCPPHITITRLIVQIFICFCAKQSILIIKLSLWLELSMIRKYERLFSRDFFVANSNSLYGKSWQYFSEQLNTGYADNLAQIVDLGMSG